MPIKAGPGEQYTIRRKIFKIFGASFHVLDAEGNPTAFCHQKALRLREDIRLYTDESKSEELLTLRARTIMDFSTTYDIALASGEIIASLRRKGMKSTFLRDEWLVFDDGGREIALIRERGGTMAFLRRYVEWVAVFSPQTFEVFRWSGEPTPGAHLATFRQHFNLFIYRLGIAVHQDDELLDDLILIAAGSLIAAIEGRQS